MRVHYPRTPHLPWSPGATADDVRSGDLAGLRGREVVVTEKLDGENTTLYRDGLHARSLDSAHHPSRAWVKSLHGRVGSRIPEGWRVCGENLYARHSIPYDDLDSFFYGFSIWHEDRCLDWDRTVQRLRELGIPTPRVLWRGVYDEKAIRALRFDTERHEGYVVRTVAGFAFEEFGERVAKWVRPSHVQTDTHWMHAEIVPNRLGPTAALWAVRSGTNAPLGDLAAAVGIGDADHDGIDTYDLYSYLDSFRRVGDVRLAGALACALHTRHRADLMSELIAPLGMPLARRVADIVGLAPRLYATFPDDRRRAGLVRMSFAADLAALHAVATLTAPAVTAAENVDWSAAVAEDAGLLSADQLAPGADPTGPASPESPLAALRSGLAEALADLAPLAAVRCGAEAREAFADGRIASVEEAVAATWRWRSGDFPHLIHLVGPSGSGKSTVAADLADAVISLDDLREARGSRADQRANPQVLADALAALDKALIPGATVAWDATSLNPRQRSLVHAVARRRDALITHAVVLVPEAELVRRNRTRANPVPSDVLTAQLRRFDPPYPGEAHRIWYIGASGIEDED